MIKIFLPDGENYRAVHGGNSLFQNDQHWRDLILFYEYFHGDNGAGLGANHQTGWTGLVATLIQTCNSQLSQDRQPPKEMFRLFSHRLLGKLTAMNQQH